MICFNDVYRGRRVLVTGHTGFKGSWMTIWLQKLGAEVIGISLDPITKEDNFVLSEIGDKIKNADGVIFITPEYNFSVSIFSSLTLIEKL